MAFLRLRNQTRIYYEQIAGGGSRPSLVFLHEGLGSTAMWGRFPHQLCAETGCPGLLYDRQGFGRSAPFAGPRGRDYLHESALDELPQVISALLPGKDFFLVGHSDGGSIALIFASRQPAHLCGLITEAAHVFVEPVTLDGIRQVVERYRRGEMSALHRYHGEKTDAVFRAWHETWLSDWFSGWDIQDVLPSISCPALILQGAQDQYATARQVDAIAAGTPGAQRIVMEGCGHTPHREKGQLAMKLMTEFIKHELEVQCSKPYHQS
jgi:pimeloyl-ACP methyl ester carboxylesterase